MNYSIEDLDDILVSYNNVIDIDEFVIANYLDISDKKVTEYYDKKEYYKQDK